MNAPTSTVGGNGAAPAPQGLVLLECIGSDALGHVFRALQPGTSEQLTLYEFLPCDLAQRSARRVVALPGRERAFETAQAAHLAHLRAMAEIQHPALPVLRQIWQDDGTVYATGPWLPGRSLLSELAQRAGPVDPSTLESWLRSMGDALATLHRHGIVHANLSPKLIRVLDTGSLLLPLPGHDITVDRLSAWAAPEQLTGEAMGAWTDIYQLSALLALGLSGQVPPSVRERLAGERALAWPEPAADPREEVLRAAALAGMAMATASRAHDLEAWMGSMGLKDRRSRPRLPGADAAIAAGAATPAAQRMFERAAAARASRSAPKGAGTMGVAAAAAAARPEPATMPTPPPWGTASPGTGSAAAAGAPVATLGGLARGRALWWGLAGGLLLLLGITLGWPG